MKVDDLHRFQAVHHCRQYPDFGVVLPLATVTKLHRLECNFWSPPMCLGPVEEFMHAVTVEDIIGAFPSLIRLFHQTSSDIRSVPHVPASTTCINLLRFPARNDDIDVTRYPACAIRHLIPLGDHSICPFERTGSRNVAGCRQLCLNFTRPLPLKTAKAQKPSSLPHNGLGEHSPSPRAPVCRADRIFTTPTMGLHKVGGICGTRCPHFEQLAH